MTSTISKGSDNRGQKSKDLGDSSANLMDSASHAVNMGRKELSDIAEKAGSNLRQIFYKTSQQVCDARDKTEEKITANPFTSIAIAAASGLILGAIFRGNK